MFIATVLQKLKKPYVDTRAQRSGVSKLNDELVDVQRIMVQNIDDVLQRGEHMSCKLLTSSSVNMSSLHTLLRMALA